MKFIKTISILVLFGSMYGCAGNPWQQFLGNIQTFVGKDFQHLKNDLISGGRHEITEDGGYKLPNGNFQHEFWWGDRKGLRCILLIEESSTSNKVVVVGGKGDTTACQWGG